MREDSRDRQRILVRDCRVGGPIASIVARAKDKRALSPKHLATRAIAMTHAFIVRRVTGTFSAVAWVGWRHIISTPAADTALHDNFWVGLTCRPLRSA